MTETERVLNILEFEIGKYSKPKDQYTDHGYAASRQVKRVLGTIALAVANGYEAPRRVN